MPIVNTAPGVGGPWQSWTPTLSGRFTDADWTKDCKYIQVGKTVYFRMSLTATDATPMAGGSGEGTFTLPVTSITYPGSGTLQPIGQSNIYDVSAGNRFLGVVSWVSTTTAHIRCFGQLSTTYVNDVSLNSTTPCPFTTSDEIVAQGFYEVP